MSDYYEDKEDKYEQEAEKEIRHIYGGKELAQVFIDKLQSIVDQMGE